jgi:hypothetical protein
LVGKGAAKRAGKGVHGVGREMESSLKGGWKRSGVVEEILI